MNFCEFDMNFAHPPPTISHLICNLHNFRVCFYHFLNRKEQIKTIINFHSCFLLLLLLSSSSDFLLLSFLPAFTFLLEIPSDLSKWKSVACMRNTLRSFFLFIWFSMLNLWIHFLIIYTIFIRINLPKKMVSEGGTGALCDKKGCSKLSVYFRGASSFWVTPHFAVLWKVEWKQWFWFVRMTWTRFICECFYY